jgi:hypothetical protein
MRAIVAALAAAALSGCAGALPFLESHAGAIAVIGGTAAAISSTESAVLNGIALGRELRKD